MPTLTTIELPPPKNWDEFEDICADLFGRMWSDPYVVRHGRAGQRQHGVDILGHPSGRFAGVQCKAKRQYPLAELTTTEIDVQVADALQYPAALSEFIIATTAANDVHLQDHAAEITARQQKDGRFQVQILGWEEISRRLNDYPDLIEKHYGLVTLRTVRREVADVGEVARVVLQKVEALAAAPAAVTAVAPKPIDASQLGLLDAAERDLERRYARAVQRSLFPDENKSDAFYALGKELLEGDFSAVSAALRRRILLRAARSTALRGDVPEAQRLLDAGSALTGPDLDLPARARVADARGETDRAIQLLRDSKDADCRSTLLSILARHQGDQAALAWLAEEGLTPADLTPNGVVTLGQIYLRQSDFDGLARMHAQTTEQQCLENPYLYFFRGAVRLASTVAKPDRERVLMGIPLTARFAHPVLPEAELPAYLDEAIADLQRVEPYAHDLELHRAERIAEVYVRWAQLLHPGRKAAAVVKLREEMADLRTALPMVQFALAYDPEFDPNPLMALLQKREGFGGLDDDELRAAFVIQLHVGDGRSVADFVARHRPRLETGYGTAGILAIEVQALASAGDATSARLLLDQHKGILPSDLLALLAADIAKAEGADPVVEHRRVYEDTKTTESLRALVHALGAKKDRRAVAHYAEELYGRTGDRTDLELAARALASIGDDENFLRVIDANPSLEKSDVTLATHHAWILFRLGRLAEAKRLAQEIARIEPKHRALDLEVSLAIESGDWPALGGLLAARLDDGCERDGMTLIRAAHLAQAAEQGPMMALTEAAVAASPDDPNVLVGAHLLVLEAGLEEAMPDSAEWFSRALDLSGPDGPIKRFELKELLSQQTEWNERTQKIATSLTSGEMPLFLAALGFRTSLADLVLRNYARNSALADPRRRAAIPVFSGRRLPGTLPETKRLAVDLSGLMTLGWLGLTSKVVEAYPEIMLPAGALGELFESRRRIRQLQASRASQARQVNGAIANGWLKVVGSEAADRELAKEVGLEVAALVHAAQTKSGVYLHPATIHRLGLEGSDADVSAYAPVLADMHGLLTALIDMGAIDQRSEEIARRYFAVQDRGWPSSATPSKDRPLFLDGLAVVYLQTVNLLDTVLDRFGEVYVCDTTRDEASGVVAHEQESGEMLRAIEDVRDAVRKGSIARKIVFGPQVPGDDDDGEDDRPDSSSMHLLRDLLGSDVVLIDDRALNKERFAVDRKTRRVPIVTTLDLIEDLRAKGVLTQNERNTLRHRLRLAGAALIPADADEIVAAATRTRQHEVPEFASIRESIALARAAELPRFPAEIPWFATLSTAPKAAVMAVWEGEADPARAEQLANAILDLRPKPEDWTYAWGGPPPPEWIEAVNRILVASLTMPIELTKRAARAAYNDWLERRVLGPLRTSSPDAYQAVVKHVEDFILAIAEDDDDE